MRFILHLNNSCYSVPGKNIIVPNEPIIPDGPNDNNYAWVDLGLPSGLLWATNNVGAASETDYGLFFAWGETTGYINGSDRSAKLERDDGFSNPAYVATGGNAITDWNLELEHDAANVNMGGDWRMPKPEDYTELINNTDYERVTTQGVVGTKFMKKTDHSVYIFFPDAGIVTSTNLPTANVGNYRTNRKLSGDNSIYVIFNNSVIRVESQYGQSRYYGVPVRAVLDNVL